MTLIPNLTFTELWMVSVEHLQRVWHASRECLPLRTPCFVPFSGPAYALIVETKISRLYTDLMIVPNLIFTEWRGFHGFFTAGVACQLGALTLPDTWFRPLFRTCLCSNCWDQIPQTWHVFTRLFRLNTPWYFLDFARNNRNSTSLNWC